MRSAEVADAGGRLWVMEADGPDDAAALADRADVLSQVRHPGVVDLRRVERDERGVWRLGTVWVGASLADLDRPLQRAEIAGLGAAVATTLADLHVLGWVHAAVEPAHVLLDADGRPVLCGTGATRRSADSRDRSGDVEQLTAMLRGLLPSRAAGTEWRCVLRVLDARRNASDAARLARKLADPGLSPRLPAACSRVAGQATGHPRGSHASGRTPADPGGSPTLATERAGAEATTDPAARQVGRQPGAPLRPPEANSTPSRTVRLPRAGRWVVAGCAAAACALLAVVVRHTSAAPVAVSCPVADGRCRPIATPAGVLTVAGGRFGVGAPGDTVVLGRWACGPTALPAVLRGRSGQIWVFDRWPMPGLDVAGRAVAHVPGATSLAVVPGRSGCDRLQVLRSTGPAVLVNPDAEP